MIDHQYLLPRWQDGGPRPGGKLITLPHEVCGMTCIVSGLEDMYEHEQDHHKRAKLCLNKYDLDGLLSAPRVRVRENMVP
jgi:hypothetical protein